MPKSATNRTQKLALARPAPLPEDGDEVVKEGVQMKRVSFYLPEPLYNDLLGFAEERGETMTGLFRWALGLSKAIWDEVKVGNRIRVAKDGKMVKEFVITP